MKKILILSFFLIFALSHNIYSQMGIINPELQYLGSTDSEQDWIDNCNNWQRTIRGMPNQFPASVDRTAVQYLIEYVNASSMVSNMRLQVNDVWAIGYPNYIVFVWLTGYNEGRWTYRSMNILTY